MQDAFSFLSPETARAAALLATRVGGVLLIAPVLASRPVPRMLRAALLVLLTALMLPSAMSPDARPELNAATLLSETVVGFAIGLGAAVVVGGAEIAGDLIAIHMGLSGATTLDPMTSHTIPMVGEFTRWFAIALVLAVNGHLLMIDALAATLEVVPIGRGAEVAQGALAMAGLGGTLFELGLRMAAPVTAAVLVGNIALGILARTAPQMHVLMVAFPVQIGIGLLTLGVALPLIATLFFGWPSHYDALVTRLVDSLTGVR